MIRPQLIRTSDLWVRVFHSHSFRFMSFSARVLLSAPMPLVAFVACSQSTCLLAACLSCFPGLRLAMKQYSTSAAHIERHRAHERVGSGQTTVQAHFPRLRLDTHLTTSLIITSQIPRLFLCVGAKTWPTFSPTIHACKHSSNFSLLSCTSPASSNICTWFNYSNCRFARTPTAVPHSHLTSFVHHVL